MIVNGKEMPDTLLILGQNIKKARDKQNVSIKALASGIAYDRICLSRLECGEQNVSYLTVVNIASALNVSFPALFSRNYSNDSVEEFRKDDFLLVFIENIRRELRANGITQTRIYIESGIQESVISRILNGKTENPTIKTLALIASVVSDEELSRLFTRKLARSEMEINV